MSKTNRNLARKNERAKVERAAFARAEYSKPDYRKPVMSDGQALVLSLASRKEVIEIAGVRVRHETSPLPAKVPHIIATHW